MHWGSSKRRPVASPGLVYPQMYWKSKERMSLQPPSLPYQWTFRRVMWATLVLVFFALWFWLLYQFNQAVFILFIAIVMGTVIRPIVNWLYWRGLPLWRLLEFLLLPAERAATRSGRKNINTTPVRWRDLFLIFRNFIGYIRDIDTTLRIRWYYSKILFNERKLHGTQS